MSIHYTPKRLLASAKAGPEPGTVPPAPVPEPETPAGAAILSAPGPECLPDPEPAAPPAESGQQPPYIPAEPGTRRESSPASAASRPPQRRWKAPLLAAAVTVCLCLLMGPSVGQAQSNGAPPAPAHSAVTALSVPPPLTLPTPTPKPTPTPAPTPPPYDFSQPVPASAPVEMAWFEDAVFLGDSRTDGLRLYSGIRGPDFLSHKGITVFDVMDRPDKRVIAIDGKKYTILEALEARQYAKVYIALGINELGYNDNQGFADKYAEMLDAILALQPEAVIYLQNITPVNPAKCREYRQPYYVTNEQVTAYNEILARLAGEKRVVLVDVASALADEAGILPREATTDGVHFSKSWYKKWLEYLMCHTADPDSYFAGRAGMEGEAAT